MDRMGKYGGYGSIYENKIITPCQSSRIWVNSKKIRQLWKITAGVPGPRAEDRRELTLSLLGPICKGKKSLTMHSGNLLLTVMSRFSE